MLIQILSTMLVGFLPVPNLEVSGHPLIFQIRDLPVDVTDTESNKEYKTEGQLICEELMYRNEPERTQAYTILKCNQYNYVNDIK